MTTIRLLDARRGLYRKCEELFKNAKIAEAIYRYLCDGIEECEDAEPERKKGKWIQKSKPMEFCTTWWYECSECGNKPPRDRYGNPDYLSNFCPNCGVKMEGEDAEIY